MRIALTALAILALHLFALSTRQYGNETRETGMAILVGFIAIEALNERRKAAKSAAAPSQPNAATVLEEALEKSKQNMAQLAVSHKEADEKAESFKTALAEAQARLAKLQAEKSSLSRDESSRAEIVSFLSLLQEKGRFVDFLMDDVSAYGDAQVGAAARVVHQGCRSVMRECFDITQVSAGKEGEKISLEKNFSPSEYRVVGRVAGDPPFHGTLLHRGWRTSKVELPRLIKEASKEGSGVIAPAEVEIN